MALACGALSSEARPATVENRMHPSMLSGPLLACSLVAFALTRYPGPGALLSIAVTVVLLATVAPVVQWATAKHSKFVGHPWRACGVSLVAMLTVSTILVLSGLFDFF
jgi:hypothetical protein